MIVATSSRSAAIAAKAATTTHPDRLRRRPTTRSRSVLSPASPGRAVTSPGINVLHGRAWRRSGWNLLRELVPGAARVAVLVNAAQCRDRACEHVEAAARRLGLQIQRRATSSTRAARSTRLSQLLRVSGATALLRARRPAFFSGAARRIGQLAARHRLPDDLCDYREYRRQPAV